MVREFKLINENGQEYSLMDIKNYGLLTRPTGLGYEYTTEYEQLGNTFISNLRRVERGQINGSINFLNYDNYKNFIDYIESSEELKLSYKIPYENGSYKEYFKDINIQSITKTEKQVNGIITETITFDCLSLWYEEKTLSYNIKHNDEDITRWDFKWDSRFPDYDISNIDLINEGHIPAPVEIEVIGRVVNPRFELWIEGIKCQTVIINTTIEEYEKLLYGTKENDFYINKQNTDGTIESLFNLDAIDFENDNVIRIPQKRSCKFKIVADTPISEINITMFVYYKAV